MDDCTAGYHGRVAGDLLGGRGESRRGWNFWPARLLERLQRFIATGAQHFAVADFASDCFLGVDAGADLYRRAQGAEWQIMGGGVGSGGLGTDFGTCTRRNRRDFSP